MLGLQGPTVIGMPAAVRLPVDENGEVEVPYQSLTCEIMARMRLLLAERPAAEVVRIMRELGEDSRCEDVELGVACQEAVRRVLLGRASGHEEVLRVLLPPSSPRERSVFGG